jgi:arginine-tRNA-protein transferase
MDHGFRRSGRIFYQPYCAACRECQPLRVPVSTFTPTKSQRRAARRNEDVLVEAGAPAPSAEKFQLYSRYIAQRHDKDSDDPESFVEFLYESPTDTLEFTYRAPDGRLIGVGICDLTPEALSSVYFFFDPDESCRSLGVFSALEEIAAARRLGRAFYYLGFWVANSPKMSYKNRFGPCELLGADLVWRPAAATSGD